MSETSDQQNPTSLGKPLSPEEMATTKGGTANERGQDMLVGAVAGGAAGAAVGAAVSGGTATGMGAGLGAWFGFMLGSIFRKIKGTKKPAA